MSTSPKLLSSLIGSIYDCVLDPSRWESALGEMVVAMRCHNALLSLTDMRYDRLLLARGVNLQEPWWSEFQKTYFPEAAAHLSRILASWDDPDKPFIVSRNPEMMRGVAYYDKSLGPE